MTNLKTISPDIENHPIYLAGKAAALAQLYFDNVLAKNTDVSEVSAAYGRAFDLCPNYRCIIQDTGKRYQDTTKDRQVFEIISLPIKPIHTGDKK